jgi:hypothetical protein
VPLFNCSQCGVIENTALGHYWWHRAKGKPVLCSECGEGEWHGQFDKCFDVLPPEPLLDGD